MVNDKLAAFLRDAAGRKVELGTWDCGLWLADWYVLQTGKPDPAKDLRGHGYNSAAQAWKVIRSLGLARTRDPRAGDVGLVSIHRGHLVGAIFSGRSWWILRDEGLASLPPKAFRFIAAWRVD